jgi:deoxyribodipyrimidine photo-lyase
MPDLKRSKSLALNNGKGPVIYWMSRDQRVHDNHSLIEAQKQALEWKTPLNVVFVLRPITMKTFNPRHYNFMLRGLMEVEKQFNELGIPFIILFGEPDLVLPKFIKEHNCALLIKDFSPLRGAKRDNEKILKYCIRNDIGFTLIDAHNIVPVWVTSHKKEYGARFFRKKLQQFLPQYLMPYPNLEVMDQNKSDNNWNKIFKSLGLDIEQIDDNYPKPGYIAGMNKVREFTNNSLKIYAANKDDPSKNAQSGLSPYLHFGQISALKVALEIEFNSDDIKNKEAFFDELITWRELAENYCYYEKDYDNSKGYPDWSIKSHNKHREDMREYIYQIEDLETANTHDQLWNATQKQLLLEGKIPGYLRMYWAKKILEWSLNVEIAQKQTIYLNDKYSLDGRDPNGYAGIAWSIGGVHDRPWFEREVFGQIRYMSFNGCKNKFNIFEYINKYGNNNE